MTKENSLFLEVKDAIEFNKLWEQAKEKVTAFSGDVWTDTGDHDPGVTLLQSATWNCSDLSYRASLPLNDLLTQKDFGPLFPEEFCPEQVLTCNTVTAEDYRKALLDLHCHDFLDLPPGNDFLFSDASLIKEPEENRFHWWHNSVKREYSFSMPAEAMKPTKLTLRGNLWLSVTPTRYTQSLNDDNRAKVDQYLNTFLSEHRNLGEMVSCITWQQPAAFNLRMAIELSGDIIDINQVAAQIYQTTDTFLRPMVTRHTTEQRRALSVADDAIFEGPNLQHGWQQTAPSQISSGGYILNLGPLVNLLLAIPGVASLSTLSVDTGDGHITAVAEENWRWQVDDGYYPLLWGEKPLDLLATDSGPLKLMSKGSICSTLNSEAMERYLTQEEPIVTVPTVLPAGRFRDQTPYIPIGQRLPECYALLQPDAVIGNKTREVHQFLLPADQLLADVTAELSLLPKLLAFKDRDESIRGTRWPYTDTMVQHDIHLPYAEALIDISKQDVAIFLGQNKEPHQNNFARELDFLQYLLGYFGTQRAALPLTLSWSDFLATQQAYLAQQPTLGYDRINICINRVSALQRRIAARIGLDGTCFADNPDLSKLPFYLIEHRQLLPQTPDITFDCEQIPNAFTVDKSKVTLLQDGSAGKVVRGQLIDLVVIENSIPSYYVNRLLVIATNGDSFTISTENSQQLLINLPRLQSAWDNHNLTWRNSNVWLQDMDFRLNYAEEQSDDPRVRVLASNAQSPYPAMVSVGDDIVLRYANKQFSMPSENGYHSTPIDNSWQLEASVIAVDPIAGTLHIKKNEGCTEEFPSREDSFLYQWAFSRSNYASTDRFSFVVSAVLNRSLLANPKIESDELLVAWVKETIMAEFPAHVSLIDHWLDDSAFRNFGATYARWQNNGSPLGDDAFALMEMLTLGHQPATQLNIGLMRIATEEQRSKVFGDSGSEWDTQFIQSHELFYVPTNEPITILHNNELGEKND